MTPAAVASLLTTIGGKLADVLGLLKTTQDYEQARLEIEKLKLEIDELRRSIRTPSNWEVWRFGGFSGANPFRTLLPSTAMTIAAAITKNRTLRALAPTTSKGARRTHMTIDAHGRPAH